MSHVVIGSSREQKLCSLVLESSIRNNTTIKDLRITHTYDKTYPIPKDPRNRSRTGFSFNRFAIPAIVDYKGTGIYLECDQLVFADVKELVDLPFGGASVLRPRNQTAVLVLDCSSLKWNVAQIVKWLDDGKFSYKDLMEGLCIEPPGSVAHTVPLEWNELDSFRPGKTKLLHYTNMAAQPWRCWGHPLQNLWLQELKRAMMQGFIPVQVVEKEVSLKFVVPQVLKEVKSWKLP